MSRAAGSGGSRDLLGRAPERLRALIAVTALLGLLVGCGGGGKDDPILRLSAKESLVQGMALMEAGKFAHARDYLTHAFEVEPNSVAGREALLMVADSHFQDGGFDNYVKSEAKYRDFQNRFPTSDRSDYVQMRIANSLFNRVERPDRDQTITRKAMDGFRDLIALYPTSEYVPEAREKIQEVRNLLAAHDFLIGHFYMRFKLPIAAAHRLETVVSEYPDFHDLEQVYFDLGRAYVQLKRTDEAEAMFVQLRTEYPDSPYLKEIESFRRKHEKKVEKALKEQGHRKSKAEKKYARQSRKRAAEEGAADPDESAGTDAAADEPVDAEPVDAEPVDAEPVEGPDETAESSQA